MAVVKEITDIKVVAKLQTGVDEEGMPIIKGKTLSNISLSASDQDKHDVVEAIAGLQDNELVGIENREYASLISMG